MNIIRCIFYIFVLSCIVYKAIGARLSYFNKLGIVESLIKWKEIISILLFSFSIIDQFTAIKINNLNNFLVFIINKYISWLAI